MAAKKDKMIPSEEERKRALKYATPAGTGRMWVTMGIAFIIFGIILLLIPIGLAISEASAQRYDPESISIQQHLYSICLAHFLVSADVSALSLVSLPSKHLRKYCARVKLTIR